MVLRHDSPDEEILSGLLKHPSFVRMAGHASGIFGTWAPKMHAYYADHLHRLMDHDKTLTRNFENSIFSACAFNFGPQTVCYRHRDHANLPFGWCGITALGNYDYKLGGHLILWDLGLVIEFPPGSTIFIPSAALEHSNASIQKHERRYSFTQYTSGGTFRWVDYGFQKADVYLVSLSEEGRQAAAQEGRDRLAFGLSLFSTLDELQ
ncbi:uncharacterized protein LACBIDRAFT_306859 [Laccaria bicolor S238N-H82]|uniref:Predicted protein n=1 Tax=Laccaria bicolor (strain S238N-H82 / ATCC MYA-4686) TaxID=486041 RepID=B0DNW0_LACBS|nr:uncharacterized protein LACBIDRAFT_306859 [Laccaria bicolor S238N-H82]EDR03722.1 predicted protein [Laccaria bicolor S238N-H82]|eukprot:XP_001885575.1 predicted protein [Laccaria bicolor S238N-H82]